ncbi:MAG: DUF5312 family protein [Brevinematia bacterium]
MAKDKLQKEISQMEKVERDMLRKEMESTLRELEKKPLTYEEEKITKRARNEVFLTFWDRVLIFIFSLFGIMSEEKYILRKKINFIKERLKSYDPPVISVRTNELLPQFGKFLYEIYVKFNAINELLEMTIFNTNLWNNTSIPELKTVVESLFEFLTNTNSLFGISDVKRIMSETKSLKGIFEKIDAEVENILNTIDPALINRANRLYTKLLIFRKFEEEVDMKRILKYFIDEKGKFSKVIPDSWLVIELEKLANILSETDITPMIIDVVSSLKKYIEEIMERESYEYERFKNVSNNLLPEELKKASESFEKLHLVEVISVLKEDPDYIPIFIFPEHSLVNEYKIVVKEKSKNFVARIIKDIVREKTSNFYYLIGKSHEEFKSKVNSIYVEETNLILAKFNLPQFMYSEAFEVVYSFYYFFWKAEFRESLEDILVNGLFKDKYFKSALSNINQSINEIEKDISSFLKQTSPGGEHFEFINKLIQNPPSLNIENNKKLLIQKITILNNLAGSILFKISDHLLQLKKYLDYILSDYSSMSPEYILNIKSIKGIKNKLLIQNLKKGYEVIDVLIQIISNFSN